MIAASVFLAALVMSAAFTGLARRYAVARDLMDTPNARRLNQVPIPRGGGIGVLLSMSVGLATLYISGSGDAALIGCVLGAGIAFGLLGWIDDHAALGASLRFVVQLLIAAMYCVALSHFGLERAFGGAALLGLAVVAIALVWCVNAFNFMDGADGLAGTECLLVAFFGALILAGSGGAPSVIPALLLAGSAAGFLCWNWPPARIFSGDVGSYCMGFYLCALASLDLVAGRIPWVWLILTAPFLTDATLTLLRRMLKREAWWRAHRSHLYQKLILCGWQHVSVVYGLILITSILLAPSAWFAAQNAANGALIASIVYLITGIMWYSSHQLLDRVE